MCISPNTLADGTQTACHKCWQCVERAINDWVGRNIAESKTAKACHAVTLTYGRNKANDVDHERSVLLTYSDVQKYLKLLRRHGYPVRYFVTGEFGSKKGRAHWHIMLYWQDKVPEHVLDVNFMEAHWPHGWSFWTEPTHNAIRYNCKYIQKDMGDDERQGHLAMSKKPPLGTLYFQELAERYVMQGLAPQTLEYKFPGVKRRKQNGQQEVVPFMLKDVPADNFMWHYVKAWDRANPGRAYPKSELVANFLDPEGDNRRLIKRRIEALDVLVSNWTPGQVVQAMKDYGAILDIDARQKVGGQIGKPLTGDDLERIQTVQYYRAMKWIEGAPDEQERQKREDFVLAREIAKLREQEYWANWQLEYDAKRQRKKRSA